MQILDKLLDGAIPFRYQILDHPPFGFPPGQSFILLAAAAGAFVPGVVMIQVFLIYCQGLQHSACGAML